MKSILSNYKTLAKHGLYIGMALLIGSAVAYAGSLTPPGAPADTMYTLDNIYNLASGATTTVGSGSIPTTPGSASATFHTLSEIYSAISGQIANLSTSTMATGTTAFGVSGALYRANTLQTYGTSDYCTNSSGVVITCAGSGLSGQYNKGQARSYTDNGNGTVSDNSTGLMWQKCQVGKSDSNCSTGIPTTVSLATATSTCESLSLGGYSDWRVPNRFELETLLTLENENPSINRTYFPNTSSAAGWLHMTSSVYAFDPSKVWAVNFSNGTVSGETRNSAVYCLRCVRGQ